MLYKTMPIVPIFFGCKRYTVAGHNLMGRAGVVFATLYVLLRSVSWLSWFTRTIRDGEFFMASARGSTRMSIFTVPDDS